MAGQGLVTAEIAYFLPDHPRLIQLFIWQLHDVAPAFPHLARFLDHWRTDIEASIHSIRIAHNGLIRPAEWRAVDGVISVH